MAVLAFILSGAGSFLLKNGLQNISANLPSVFLGSNFINLIIVASVVAIIFAIISGIVSSILGIASIIIVDNEGKTPLGTTLRRGLGLVIPLTIVNLLTFFLTFGALFVFVLPALLFYFLFSFVQFEVVLNNQRWISSIKRSVSIVSGHFGAILIRLIVLFLIYLGYVIITSLLNKIGPDVAIFVGILSFILNLLLGWFSLAYMITLYKQARAGIKQENAKGILWIWVIAVLGWIIAAFLFFASYKVLSSGILNQVMRNSSSSPGSSIQRSINEMQPEAKIHYDKSQDLFKQMRAVQKDANKNNEQIIAETKKLNDENIAELKRALEIEPNNPKVWYELGNAYTWFSTTGRLEDGLAAYQKAEELDPKNIVYINGAGDMMIMMNRNEEAILQLQKTLRLTDKSGFANLSIARAYTKLKVYDSARENYQKAIEIFTSENSNGSYDSQILQAKKELATLPK